MCLVATPHTWTQYKHVGKYQWVVKRRQSSLSKDFRNFGCYPNTFWNFVWNIPQVWWPFEFIVDHTPWWRHQMETFSALLATCAGNSPATGEFPAHRPVTRSFDVFFDLRLNKRLSKHSWSWWFETLSRTLWRHCNVKGTLFHCPPFYFGYQ